MAKSKIMIEVYDSKKTPDRDLEVSKKISAFFKANIKELSDGMIQNTLVISGATRDSIAKPYNITQGDWKHIQSSPEYKMIGKTATPLKLGLLISYCQTKSRHFLIFLFALDFSARMAKFFRRGYDRKIMRYTLENSDDRTDFRKYGMSLINVLNKKVDTFILKYDKYFKSELTDDEIRMLIQSISTRMNAMVRAISKKYYENFHDKDVKIMMQYSKTLDGKNVLSPLNIMETIREKAVDNLSYPSDQVLKMIGLVGGITGNTASDNEKRWQRRVFIDHYDKIQNHLIKSTNAILDEWIGRVGERLSLKIFRMEFLKTMSVARNVSYINDILDEAVELLIKIDKPSRAINRIEYRKKLFLYLLANIYTASKVVI